MRIATALLTIALAIPSLAFAAGQQNKSIVAPTTKTWKTVIKSAMSAYKDVPARTLHSAKFAKFRADGKNYLAIDLNPKLRPGMITEGGTAGYVGRKIYPNKIFVQTSFLGRSRWSWGEQPKF